MKNINLKLMGMCALAAMMMPTSVLALDAYDFSEKFSNTLGELSGIEITFDEAQADGNQVILSGWNLIGLPETDEPVEFTGSLTFSNVLETEQGGYTADEAVFSDVDFVKEGVHLKTSGGRMTGINIAAEPTMLDLVYLYDGAYSGPITVSIEDEVVFSIDSISTSYTSAVDSPVLDSVFSIDGIFGDISKIEDKDAEEIFEVLGLDALNASMSGSGSWDVDTGRMIVESSAIKVDQVGTLDMGFNILGYTLDLVEQLQEMNKLTMAAGSDPEMAQAQSMQMVMTMATLLSIHELSIRFEDDSVTHKMMDFVGQKEGLSRKGIISTVAQALPEILSELQMPELQAEITDAVVSFLRDPQSIEIKAAPEEAVPFMALMAVAQNPSIARDLLNLSIVANQPK